MPARRLFAILWCLAALALMLWSWASWQGPFRWAAEWQVRPFGSYNEKLTLFVPLILLMLPAGFIGGWGPLVPPPATHAARLASARRSVKVTAILGAVALLLGAVAGGLGYRRMQTPPMQATLVLTTGTEPAPETSPLRYLRNRPPRRSSGTTWRSSATSSKPTCSIRSG